MTSVHPSAGPAHDLLRDVGHAHRHAGAALDDPAQSPLAAVTWASAHLAAVTRVLHPLACRTLPDGRERTTTGRMDGRLLRGPVGDNGFGYDPLFVADGQTVSNGVLDADAKDAISHRGRAVRAMVPVLVEVLTERSAEEA